LNNVNNSPYYDRRVTVDMLVESETGAGLGHVHSRGIPEVFFTGTHRPGSGIRGVWPVTMSLAYDLTSRRSVYCAVPLLCGLRR